MVAEKAAPVAHKGRKAVAPKKKKDLKSPGKVSHLRNSNKSSKLAQVFPPDYSASRKAPVPAVLPAAEAGEEEQHGEEASTAHAVDATAEEGIGEGKRRAN